MNYNINFWTPPDWKREGNISPNFLLGVTIASFLVLSVFLYSITENQKNQVATDLEKIQTKIKEVEPRTKHLRNLEKSTQLWQNMLDLLEKRKNHRIIWSRQLEALQRTTTPNIIFKELSVRDETVRVEKEAAASEKKPTIKYYTVYHLQLNAIAQEEQNIIELNENINRNENISRLMQDNEIEIKDISELNGTAEELYPDGNSFILNWSYKKIPEVF